MLRVVLPLLLPTCAIPLEPSSNPRFTASLITWWVEAPSGVVRGHASREHP
jgi:hypothetical protein